MRDFIKLAEEILQLLKKGQSKSKKQKEFYRQIEIFIRKNKFYPTEARLPWDTLGHLVREYCDEIEPSTWQKQVVELMRCGHGKTM